MEARSEANGFAPDGAGDAASVAGRLAEAREARRAWAARPLGDRLAVVRRLRHLIAGEADALARAIRSSRRGPLAEALAAEVLPLADACRFLERRAASILRARRLGASGRPAWLAGVRSEVRREPIGVVLVIGPFNYPLFLPGVQAIQALVAGNAVLLKPGDGGGPSASALAGLSERAGLPPGLLQVLPEEAEAAEAAIDAGVDKVVLTGSATTGERVLAALAPRLVPATMELSGCDAAFVRPDADLDLVARALRFGLAWNGGATCIAPRRVFVAAEVARDLERRLVAAIDELPPRPGGRSLDPKAAALVADAIGRGARLVAGSPAGEAGPTPTVVADARADMPLLREEVFAPVLALVPVRDEDEALRAAAACPYALGATVFGGERAARDLAGRIDAGVVVINDVIVPTADPRLPFGGRGRSGFGLTRGAEGLLEMTVAKVISARGGPRYHLDGPSFTDDQLIYDYIQTAHGATLRGRWKALGSLVSTLVGTAHGGSVRKGGR